MFKEDLFKLKVIIDDLSKQSEKKLRNKIIKEVLNKKLDRSYNNYAQMITSKINYILSRNNYKVIKSINKMKKEEEEAKLKKEEGDYDEQSD